MLGGIPADAKVALMGRRNTAGSRSMENAAVLSFGDNVAEVLAQERGRARDHGMNARCCQSQAWQLSVGIDCRRRRVVSGDNVSDDHSRRADRCELPPGGVLVPRPVWQARVRKRAQ